MEIQVTINGKLHSIQTDPNVRVADLLRGLGLLSVKIGCDYEGTCGSCAVLLDGRLINSCLLSAGQIHGRTITTVEGINQGRQLHPIQKAFLDAGVVQCGYCTPAMVLAVYELLGRNAQPDKAEIQDALAGILCRCTGYEQIFQAVSRLTGDTAADQDESFRKDLRIVGKDVPRIDGYRLVTGKPSFVEDMIQPATLHIAVLGSPHAHARIRSIDTTKAEACPGVVRVFTHLNTPKIFYNSAGQGYPEPSPYDRRLIDEKVRHVGDRVAIIAAESREIAEKARALIEIDYEILPAVFDPFAAARPNAPLVHERDPKIDPLSIGQIASTNLAASSSGGIGDISLGLSQADTVITRNYSTSRVQCTPLEAHVCHTYLENERLVIRASTQVPWHLRRIVARVLGIRENQIHVIKERIGGGFGAKQDIVVEDMVSFVTWETGRPAFYKMTRQEEFVSSRVRHPMYFEITVGAKKDGTLTAIDMKLTADTGAYGCHCLTVPMNSCSKSLPLFTCQNMHFEVRSYYTNSPVAGAYQGYGAPQGSFAIQLAMAEMADALGLDQIEFLRKNMVQKGSRLEILKCLGEGQEGIPQVVSSCGLAQCVALGAKQIGWGKKEKNSDSSSLRRGKAMAVIQQGSGLPGIDSANASLQMLGDGTFMLLIGGTDLGTGLDTMAVKVAAEILGVDVSDISLLAADTDATPFDKGAYASSGTYFTGMAVYRAAEKMKAEVLSSAGEILKADPKLLKIAAPGMVIGNGLKISFAQIAHKTQGGEGIGQLITTASFATHESPIPYGAHFAEVVVNTLTGQVTVEKYFAVQDCGTPINPNLAKGQIFGGVLKSIGHTLYEELKFDEHGQCQNANFLDYKVPMILDLPEKFEATLVPVDDPLGPFGAKSVSEIATNGAAPTIAAAIHQAAGIWIRDWPISPAKVLAALKEKNRKA
ncbi:MAG: molybdopterin-dependent oxidoreductase [Candidatus Eisenbacteria bacterium]|nr:molybdopterin-dependent oxidoreductase [Candidatus Eisenbacteria bacterium]